MRSFIYILLISLCAFMDFLFLGAALIGIEQRMYISSAILFLLAIIPTAMLVFLYQKYKHRVARATKEQTDNNPLEEDVSPKINGKKVLSILSVVAVCVIACVGWLQYFYLKDLLPSMLSSYYEEGYEQGVKDKEESYIDESGARNVRVFVTSFEADKYHQEGCQYLKGANDIEISLYFAVENGFRPCSVCEPPVMWG